MQGTRSIRSVFLVLVWTSCAPAATTREGPQVGGEAAEDEISQVRSSYQELYNAQNAAGVAALYAEDAVLSAPNEEPASGRESIEQSLQRTFDQFDAQVEISAEETEVAGDWAFDAGTATQTLAPKGGGESREMESSYLVILKRQDDGSWKLARTVVSSNAPLPQ